MGTRITESHLATRGKMMPGRKSATVYKRRPRDMFAAGVAVLCEKRPHKKKELRTSDASSEGSEFEIVFQSSELGAIGLLLYEGDVINHQGLWLEVDLATYEMLEQRVRCYCSRVIALQSADIEDGVSTWILASGVWNDAGEWVDTENWQDS